MIDDLYQDIILDHYRNPRNKRAMKEADVDLRKSNPLCGDEVQVQLRMEDGRIAEADYQGQGCSISQASASMLTEALTGRSMEEAQRIARAFNRMMKGQGEPGDHDLLGDLLALQGVSQYPVRIKCALLAWDTFESGAKGWEAQRGKAE